MKKLVIILFVLAVKTYVFAAAASVAAGGAAAVSTDSRAIVEAARRLVRGGRKLDDAAVVAMAKQLTAEAITRGGDIAERAMTRALTLGMTEEDVLKTTVDVCVEDARVRGGDIVEGETKPVALGKKLPPMLREQLRRTMTYAGESEKYK